MLSIYRLLKYAVTALLFLFAAAAPAPAQDWPTRQPIKVIVPFTAGSATDITARTVVDQVGRQIGQTFVVENRGGAGTTLGSGVVLVYSETADLGDALVRIAEFFRHESCGQCVPCRVGTVRQEELLERLRSGRTIGSTADELALFHELAQAMRDASICGLGQAAPNAFISAMQFFLDEPLPTEVAGRA